MTPYTFRLSAFAKVMPGGTDRRGSMAVIIALVIVALLGMVALATDTSQAIAAHARLNSAADTAALAALRSAAAAYAKDPQADLKTAEAAGVQRFRSQATGTPNVTLPVVAVSVQHNGLIFTAAATYTATYNTQIAGLLHGMNTGYGNFATFPLGGTATAQESAGAYIDIYVLMDVSNSMAVGATDAARTQLMGLTTKYPLTVSGSAYWPNCAIACHMQQPLTARWKQQYGDYYAMAKFYGVLMRIDVLKNAVGYVASILATSQHAAKFQFGLYTFDTDVHTVYPLGLPSGAASSITATEVTPINDDGPNGNYNQTNVGQSITAFGKIVGQAGDGSSQQKARKYIFILTDGIEDYTAKGNTRATAPFDPKVCQGLKDKGAIVLVLHTTNDDPNNQFGENGILAQVAPLLKQCASSPDLYTAASTPDNISAAIRTMVNFAVSTPAQFTR